jgi:PRTRC genetic system protein F
MTALVIPRIGAQVPCSVTPTSLTANNAALSRFLIEAEAFTEADIPAAWDDSLSACQQALDAWLKREIGPLHCLAPGFYLRACAYERVEIVWSETDVQEWPVGKGLERLNACLPGLGTVVFHILCCKSESVYPLFTPCLAFETCSSLYWCGLDNEEDALDMNYGDDEEEEREIARAEMVTSAVMEASCPAWARGGPRGVALRYFTRFLRRALKRLTGEARQVAADALALALLEFDGSYAPDAEGLFVGFGGVLSWQQRDVTVHIFEDLVNYAYQCEGFDYMGETEIPLNDPAAFGAWQRSMRPRFKAIGLIDRLIHRLSA